VLNSVLVLSKVKSAVFLTVTPVRLFKICLSLRMMSEDMCYLSIEVVLEPSAVLEIDLLF